MIDVGKVRVDIGDRLKWNVPRSVPPELLGIADGARTTFQLKLTRASLSTIEVQFGTPSAAPPTGAAPPIAYLPVLSTDATYPWTPALDSDNSAEVVFGTAPPAGKLVSSYYKTSQFTDAEIQDYIARCTVGGDDARLLKGIHRDMIAAMVSDPDRMEVRRIGDTSFDRNEYIRAKLELRKQFDLELSAAIDTSGPAANIGRGRIRSRNGRR